MDSVASKLQTDTLLNAAMELVADGKPSPLAEVHTRLVEGARRFALRANPRRPLDSIRMCGEVRIESEIDRARLVVCVHRGDDVVVVSGPPGLPSLWCLDRIAASEADAFAMLEAAIPAFNPGARRMSA